MAGKKDAQTETLMVETTVYSDVKMAASSVVGMAGYLVALRAAMTV